MNSDYIHIGSTGFAQVGTPDYWEKQRFEGEFIIKRVQELFPFLPHFLRLVWKGFPHDFGTYHELIVYYPDVPEDESFEGYTHDQIWKIINELETIDFDEMEMEIHDAYNQMIRMEKIRKRDNGEQFLEAV